MNRFFLCVLFWTSAYAVQDPETYRILDEIALNAKTDKASNFHNYTEVYSQYFAPLRNSAIKFLEIGIYKGHSVKLWEDYFQNGELHFIDYTLANVEYSSPRSKYHIADQSNPKDLAKVIQTTGGEFDLILDDGGHTMKQQIASFSFLFPHLKSGGLYIIEDLHTSYWPEYGGGNNPNTTMAFLKRLLDDVNFVGASTRQASHLNIDPTVLKRLSTYQKEIYSIHFYDSLAIIIKR